MKRFLALTAAIAVLCCCVCFGTQTVYADDAVSEADIVFSAKGAVGKPDETVTYQVYVDKNVGTYSMCVDVYYDNEALLLLSVENGEVFEDREFSQGPLNQEKNGDGYIRYYAELADAESVNEKTGLLFELEFQVLKSAVNGNHSVKLDFPDKGKGWFFYIEDYDDMKCVDLTVECVKQAVITVVGSSQSANQETNDLGVVPNTQAGETTKAPVTAYVTDDENKLIKNEDGKYETYVVTDTKTPIPEYVTDEDGEPITDENGDYVTVYDPDSTTDANSSVDLKNTSPNTPAHRLILIASILAVAAAAIIVIITVTKNNGNENTSAENTQSSDNTEDS